MWPHSGGVFKPVEKSTHVNLSVWPTSAVQCGMAPANDLTLWRAHNNDPAMPVDVEDVDVINRDVDGVAFPSLEFNSVSANMAADPGGRYYFFTGLDSNVWVDAADPRTYLPYPQKPTGFSESNAPSQLDGRIQIVWPHDAAGAYTTVDKATYVNVVAELFEHGTLKAVPLEYSGKVVLYMADFNGPLKPVATGKRTSHEVNGVEYPRWEFNDIPVKANGQYQYLIQVEGVTTYPTIWTHAYDARTWMPHPEAPPPCY